MKPRARAALIAALIGICVLAIYFFTAAPKAEQSAAPPAPPPPPEAAAPNGNDAPKAVFRVAPNKTGLDESNKSKPVDTRLSELFGSLAFDSLFVKEGLIRKFVLAVDGADGHAEPREEFSPLRYPEPGLVSEVSGDGLKVSPANFDRYVPYVNLARSIDTDKLIKVYVDFYPQIQAAYDSLEKKKYFNDRLIEVIDSLLKTPIVNEPIEIVRDDEQKRFRFSDEQLEDLSAIQKLLIRMGPSNSQIVRGKLLEIRQHLIHLD